MFNEFKKFAMRGNVLDMAKLSSSHFELEQRPFHLGVTVHAVLVLVEQAARQKDVQLTLQGAEYLDVDLTGDRARLSQVLLNLLVNAIRHTREGSVVLEITPQPVKQAGYAGFSFQVRDSGEGIPPEKLALIFEPYRQANTNRRQREGVGLGLSISHQLVERMGGELTVSSKPGVGSTFSFTLELPQAGEQLSLDTPTQARELRLPAGLRVLLADDSELNRFVGEAMLNNLGVDQVTLAAAGEKVLLHLQEQDYDLILLDISMPGMDGFELMTKLRSQPRNANTPVIAATGHALPEIEKRAYAAGMRGYLSKPFSYSDLHAEMTRVLREHPGFVPDMQGMEEAVGTEAKVAA